MSSLNIRRMITAALLLVFPLPVAAEQIIFVDFKNARLLHYYGEKQTPDTYPIVLPRVEVQQQMQLLRPIHGTFTQADYKPTWWPTQNMRRRDPSLPSEVRYGQPRHPIGIYRLRIAWENPLNPLFWQAVRIHGGAKDSHLYGGYSSGCIRMLDEHIIEMVENIRRYGGSVRVTFMPRQFL